MRSPLPVLKCWGPGDAEATGKAFKRREQGGGKGDWVYYGRWSWLAQESVAGERMRGKPEVTSPPPQPHEPASSGPRYITPYSRPREATWASPSASPEMQKGLPLEGIFSQSPICSQLFVNSPVNFQGHRLIPGTSFQ